MLSCRITDVDAVSGSVCCRFAPAHRVAPVRGHRYPSDTTDAQWALIEPLLPDPAWLAGMGGRPEAHCRRRVVDAIFYLVDNGCKWRALPFDFPPWQTVYKRFAAWPPAWLLTVVLATLNARVRQAAGRAVGPSAAVIDSQSVRAAETVGRESRGYDAGKKINGRKRHIAVDTMGLLLAVLITPASTQDRVAAPRLLRRLRDSGARVRHVWADGGYTGPLIANAHTELGITVEIVKRPKQKTFIVLPRRWVVERTLAWITRHRRCARDHERHLTHHQAMVCWAMIRLTSKRLTKTV